MGGRRAARLGRRIAGVLFAISIGCGETIDEPPARRIDAEPRVVSLSPAMTTILLDLAPEADLAGRTPWCRDAPTAPVVGTLEGVDAELLVQIQPDVLLVQPPASGVDPVILSLQEAMGFRLVARRLDGLADVRAVIDELVAAKVVDPVARDAWSASSTTPSDAKRGPDVELRLLLLHGVDPFRAVGTETYLDEMIGSAGCVNALQRPGWIELGVESLVSLEPEVVVVIGDPPNAIAMLDAVPWRRAPVVLGFDHPDVFEPSTRIPAVNAAFRAELESVSITKSSSEPAS